MGGDLIVLLFALKSMLCISFLEGIVLALILNSGCRPGGPADWSLLSSG